MNELGLNFPPTTRYWNLKKKSFCSNICIKMTHPFFHDALILVSVGIFLTHRFETVGVFAHFLCVKNAKTPSIWSSGTPTNDLIPPIRHTRNHHSLAFQIPMAGTDIYKSSFFPQTITDCNSLTNSLISASKHAVDSVTKFTFLVRARD